MTTDTQTIQIYNISNKTGYQTVLYNVSVLGREEGYTMKYGLSPREFPRAQPGGTPEQSELRHLVTFSTTTLYNTLLTYCFLQLRLQLQLQLKLQLMLHTLRFSHYIFRYTGCFTLS